MQEIHFLRDDSTKEIIEQFEEIKKLLGKRPEKEKNIVFGTRFIYSIIRSSARLMEEEREPLKSTRQETPRINMTSQKLALKKINQKIKTSRPFHEEEPLTPPPEFPVRYSLLISKNKSLVTVSVTRDNFGKVTYNLLEPKIDKNLVNLARKKIKLRFKLKKKVLNDEEYLAKKIKKSALKLNISYNEDTLEGTKYYLFRDMLNFGKIDSLFHDPRIKQIICDGKDKPLVVEHAEFGKINTNIIMKKEEIDELIERVAEKKDQKLNKKNPNLNILIEGFRMKATIGFDLFSSKFVLVREVS